MDFSKIIQDKEILKAVQEMGFKEPTEIQKKSIPPAIEGRDIIAQSMTGSGKTLAFSVPILHKIEKGKGVQALIISPTRELANQIANNMKQFSRYKHITIAEVFGGVSIEPQIEKLRHAEIVIGTPGRILDHISRKTADFKKVRFFVLDEADRMLDMGFIDDIKLIMKSLPKEKQSMLFSATMPAEIENLARKFMNNPVFVKTQSFVPKSKLRQFYFDVRKDEKISLLIHLIKKEKPRLAIVFCNTKRATDFVADILAKNGIEAKAIHGDLSQNARMSVLDGFHRGHIHVLVATDVAARGLDIKDVTHIFNYDIPSDSENYTHRIGRTARIGKEGKVISLLSQEDHEAFRRVLRTHEIEKMPKENYQKIRIEKTHHFNRHKFKRRHNKR